MKKIGVFIDITNQIYGNLLVICCKGKNERNRYIWECKCNCGKIKIITGQDLRSGHTKSCGCLKSPSDEEYIEWQKKRLLKYSENINGCWIWKKTCRQKFGYGWIQWRKKNMAAHRAAWMAWKGEIPKGICVCHHCDQPSCINPDHLFLSDQKGNIHDMIKKGRQKDANKVLKGKNHPHSLLKEEDVIYIRNERKNKTSSLRELAKKFNVSVACIKDANSRSWKHI